MVKPRVLLSCCQFPQEIVDKLTKNFEVQMVNKSYSEATRQDLLENIPGNFGLLLMAKNIAIDEDVINAAGSSLRVISVASMGYDRIDTNALKKRNILLGNCSTTDDAQEVAEFAVGLLIATANKFFKANKQIKTGKTPNMPCGMGLTNSVVGIVGCGNIGIAVAEILSGFKLKELLYTSRKPKPEVERLDGKMVSVDDLVRRSDFIILTMVLTPETKFIINKDRLALMKPNAVIINVGRGLLIDQDALINALQEKRIRGAGLDVMTPEPLPLDNPMIMMENVVVLPHIAGGHIDGSFLRKAHVAADNILAVLHKHPMPSEVKL